MTLTFMITGLRYYALKDKWQQMFADDGALKQTYLGTKVMLVADNTNPVTFAVAALVDGKQWGNVRDDDKKLAQAELEQQRDGQLVGIITGGNAAMRALLVCVDIMDGKFPEGHSGDNPFCVWARQYANMPRMDMPQKETRELWASLNALEGCLRAGKEARQYVDEVVRLIRYDLSEESHARELEAARVLSFTDDGYAKMLTAAVLGLGSTETSRWWVEERLPELTRSAVADYMMDVFMDVPREQVEEAVKALPNHFYRRYLSRPADMMARLYYERLPWSVLCQIISALVFLKRATPQDAVKSPIYLSRKRGEKIDFIRLMNAYYETGHVTDAFGGRLSKREFFTALGKAFNVDLSDYDNDLSRTLSDGTAEEKHLRIFKELQHKMEDIFNLH